jgi:hypothetical protein
MEQRQRKFDLPCDQPHQEPNTFEERKKEK